MEKNFLFIINPTAGQGAGRLALPEIERLANQAAIDYKTVMTERPGHAIELARQAVHDHFSYVIAVGGDGTSNEVLNGIVQAWSEGEVASTLGIIGIGRGNDFAFGFGISPGLEAGFEVIKSQRSRSIDVGCVTGGDYPLGRYFGNGIGIGFDAVVGFEAAKITYLHGFLNYVAAALRTIFLFFSAPIVKITLDDKSITQPALMVSIMNGIRMGGGFMMAPDAKTDDGLLNYCIAGQVSRIGILKLIPQFMKGTQASSPHIITGTSSKVNVVAMNGFLPAHADGETICVAGKELTVEIIKQPIKILCG